MYAESISLLQGSFICGSHTDQVHPWAAAACTHRTESGASARRGAVPDRSMAAAREAHSRCTFSSTLALTCSRAHPARAGHTLERGLRWPGRTHRPPTARAQHAAAHSPHVLSCMAVPRLIHCMGTA